MFVSGFRPAIEPRISVRRSLMLQRCSASRLLPSLQKRIVVISKQNVPKHFSPHPVRVCVRGYASSGAVSGSSSSTSAHSGLAVFAPLTNELDKICPRFEIDGEDIEVLRGPVEFYEALKVCDVFEVASVNNEKTD